MSNTMQIIAAAMQADADTLRVVSQNIANAETTAYRRQVPVSHLQFDQALGVVQSRVAALSVEPPAPTGLQVAFDMRPASLKSTGEPLNLALDGRGFFVLQSSDGMFLTRRGDLRVGADGTLLGASGAPILGDRGPIQIGTESPTIAADGSVSVNGELIDRLRVVDVSDPSLLSSIGDGVYRVDASNVVEGTQPASVRQGFLESSNVAPVGELMQLMETVRRFEAEQKFVRAYDGMLDKAISELGKVG